MAELDPVQIQQDLRPAETIAVIDKALRIKVCLKDMISALQNVALPLGLSSGGNIARMNM
jgi:hypothetical protein